MNDNGIGKGASREKAQRSPYKKPVVQRVELAIDETLGGGCKATFDPCIQDDIHFDLGS